MAFFELSETSEVAVGWVLMLAHGDLLGLVHRDAADAPWKAIIRIRTQVDDKIEDSADRKTGYRIDGRPDDQSRDDLVERIDSVVTGMCGELGGRIWRMPVYGPADNFIREFQKHPWAHSRVVAAGPKRPQ